MKNICLIILVIGMFVQSCTTPKIIEPVVPDVVAEDSSYIWRTPIFSDTSLTSHGNFLNYLSETKILASSGKLGVTDTSIISMFEKSSSYKLESLWEWQDYFPDVKQSFDELHVSGSLLYLNARSAQYCIDLNDGSTLWRHRITTGGTVDYFSSVFEDKVFHIRNNGDTRSTIWMANIQDGNWEPIFSTEMQDSYGASLYPPEGTVNANGDTILYFQNRGYRYGAPRNHTDFYAYNLSKKEVLWKLDNFPDETSNTSPPELDELNRRIYFSTWHTLFCWDMDTGEEIWSYPLEYAGILGTDYLLHDGKLIMKTDQGYLWAVDAATGQELYYVKQGGCCVGRMDVHNGRIYYSDQAIWISDVNTGMVIEKIGGKFASLPPIMDETNGVLYTMDYWYMYCMKIPE